MDNTSQLLSSLDSYAPAVQTQGFDPKEINLDRLGELASADLKKCEALNLITDVWRGRIISTTRSVFMLREASPSYENWLKRNGLTTKKADQLIRVGEEADELIDKELISVKGLSRITTKAFATATTKPKVLEVVASLAENGDNIDDVTVQRLLDEETIASSDFIPEEIKEAVSESKIPANKTAKFVDQLELVGEEQSKELAKTLAESPDIDTLKHLSKEAAALAKFLEKAPLVVTAEIDQEGLLREAQQRDCLDIMTKTIAYVKAIEDQGIKYSQTWQKLVDASDRLYVEGGAAYPNLRALADLFNSSTSRQISIPRGEDKGIVRITLEIFEDSPDSEKDLETSTSNV